MPKRGYYRYMPPRGYNSASPLPKGPRGGYLDRFGNEWQEGPAHGLAHSSGHLGEWDVQLCPAGVTRWGRHAKKGTGGRDYINVTRDGRLSH
ncbi:MAG: polymorphic toxin type 17 domain-containing protein [Thermoguttaceae bacterium]